VRLGDEHGRADPTSGVTIGAGAAIAAQPAASGLRAVKLVDDFLDATGYAPAEAIGEVWVAGEHEVYEPSSAASNEPPPTSTGVEIAIGPIRETPREAAPVVATAKQVLPARIVRELSGWDEIEVHAQRVRVHGYVPAASVTKDAGDRGYMGFGGGGGYGVSDVTELDVPAGVCLYDRVSGDVIGVETDAKRRYSEGMVQPGWWLVMVGNDWGILNVVVHDVSAATDPKAASWETCTK
jgi:hypothetical protein